MRLKHEDYFNFTTLSPKQLRELRELIDNYNQSKTKKNEKTINIIIISNNKL